ncbi:response regulator [Paenibacillus sp. KQZ6P-2]|uniref:Response regulator n=1 Tax=Paenibacillus mangrovi TaxID=2931978 RepID=A0A9X1WPG2_9BACL|nr:response regulator [Paenibacillus mangrovi]MCJ8012653.1 response regulator [Paenibacillus mangrovi]
MMMYKMLVVDDDRSEREGVKFLTKQFNWELEIAEADCGETALAYIRDNCDIDILLTDIRMRELDGLQLAQQVKQLSPHTKIIFMSAYGEFEYAQKAIDLKAIHYILKPVEIGEFMRVVSNVIQMCDEDRQEKMKNERIQEVYWKGIRYEKQKFLYDLIQGRGVIVEEDSETSGTVIHFSGYRYMRMLMIHAGSRFFDLIDLDAEALLTEMTGGKADFVNLNEVQSVLLYEGKPEETEDVMKQMGTLLVELFKEKYSVDVTLIISGLIENLGQITSEYNLMETMLASKFFMEQGAVLYTGEVITGDRDVSLYTHHVLMDMMAWLKEIEVDSSKIALLIEMLQEGKTVSENYVKFVCTELLKSILGRPTQQNVNGYMMSLERINHASSLIELLKVMQSITEDLVLNVERPQELLRRVIEDVVRIIDREYSSELTLESIARQVYLSPGYLSRLFKKYKGKSIIKHITSIRLERAGELLLTTNKKITDIGKEVGYPNFAYFSSLFKNCYGKTPSQYREEYGL